MKSAMNDTELEHQIFREKYSQYDREHSGRQNMDSLASRASVWIHK